MRQIAYNLGTTLWAVSLSQTLRKVQGWKLSVPAWLSDAIAQSLEEETLPGKWPKQLLFKGAWQELPEMRIWGSRECRAWAWGLSSRRDCLSRPLPKALCGTCSSCSWGVVAGTLTLGNGHHLMLGTGIHSLEIPEWEGASGPSASSFHRWETWNPKRVCDFFKEVTRATGPTHMECSSSGLQASILFNKAPGTVESNYHLNNMCRRPVGKMF